MCSSNLSADCSFSALTTVTNPRLLVGPATVLRCKYLIITTVQGLRRLAHLQRTVRHESVPSFGTAVRSVSQVGRARLRYLVGTPVTVPADLKKNWNWLTASL